jgi:membrane protein
MNKPSFTDTIKITFRKWQKHDPTLRAGAIAFFTIMPLPSLMLITLAVLAQIYGQEQALQHFIHQVSVVAGPAVADLLSELLKNAQSPLTSILSSMISVAFAITGALGAFSVLKKSINITWEISPSQSKKVGMAAKIIPFLSIIAAGLLVVTWAAFSTVFFAGVVFVLNPIFGGLTSLVLRALQVIVSLGLGTLLFAIIFKQLPDTDVTWGDVGVGALITGFVFTVLNYAFGIYLTYFNVSSLAGTAGTLMLLVLWIYLTALFILFGAQYSKVYAETRGSHSKGHPRPKQEKDVERVDVKAKIELKVSSESQGGEDQ